jgi:acetylornithine/succinyldiaminopimelate/putrescine aminotransferase
MNERLTGAPVVREIRGIGLMVGIELNEPGASCVEACRRRGLLINCTAERVLRLLPPLIVTRQQCRTAAKILGEVLDKKGKMER